MNTTKTYTFDDLLIMPVVHSNVKSRRLVNVTPEGNLTKLPIMSASMAVFDTDDDGKLYTGFAEAMARVGGLHIFSRTTSLSDRIEGAREIALGYGGNTVGIAVSLDEYESNQKLLESLDCVVSIDIANGAIMGDTNWHGKYPLIIGNFGNPVAPMRDHNNVMYKMGIGGGAACTTRIKTGVGAPQAWLVAESYKHRLSPDVKIISDGGIRKPADFVKAIALGADYVMLGSVLAGVVETPRKKQYPYGYDGKPYKPFFGMASLEATRNHSYVEGISGYVPYTDKLLSSLIINDYIQGLTSAMTYVDASNIQEFRENIQWLETTPTVVVENSTALR